jgi:hypothetical protein
VDNGTPIRVDGRSLLRGALSCSLYPVSKRLYSFCFCFYYMAADVELNRASGCQHMLRVTDPLRMVMRLLDKCHLHGEVDKTYAPHSFTRPQVQLFAPII